MVDRIQVDHVGSGWIVTVYGRDSAGIYRQLDCVGHEEATDALAVVEAAMALDASHARASGDETHG
jgi:hypothetical protein